MPGSVRMWIGPIGQRPRTVILKQRPQELEGFEVLPEARGLLFRGFGIAFTLGCFENPGDKLRVGEVLSKQNQLYLDLGVTPPTPYVETTL